MASLRMLPLPPSMKISSEGLRWVGSPTGSVSTAIIILDSSSVGEAPILDTEVLGTYLGGELVYSL